MYKLFSFMIMLMITCFLTACSNDDKEETSKATPTIETVEVTHIEARSALSGGNISNSNGDTIISLGICWSTHQNPTIGDNIAAGQGSSASFLCTLVNLFPNTTYYVRAYATNNIGTGYGQQLVFTTLTQPGGELDSINGIIYLWHTDNMPSTTIYTSNPNNQYNDNPDFRPNLVKFEASPNIAVKGAVILCSGGAFSFRNNRGEGEPVARALNELGYQCFLVNYRLRPYTQEEGALDLARAVRYVRSHSTEYRIDEKDIAVMGFSAGGILCGELLLNYKGIVNGAVLDSRYVPDQLDNVSANATAIGHIYSFYGRLSVASTDVELFRRSNLPPAYFCYGTRDPFVSQFAACVDALKRAGVSVETNILEGMPHGYGAGGNWIPAFDIWLTNIFKNN